MKLLLTKIVATLGPASAAPEIIRQLIDVGVRVFRLNFSHGTFDEHSQLLATVRSVASDTGVPVAVLGDLSGPKIRVGEVVKEGVMLEKDAQVEFVKDTIVTRPPAAGGRVAFSTSYPAMVDEVEEGEPILLDDGKVRLTCLGKTEVDGETRLLCEVTHEGPITSRKGVNLPQTNLSLPSLTEKDHACARFAVENDLDYVALSFVRSAADVIELRSLLTELARVKQGAKDAPRSGKSAAAGDSPKPLPIISKIEKPQAVAEIDAIVDASDGIMVARGDLGVEMDLAEVPVVQKQIIEQCHTHGKPVIVATQMLETMIESPTPTRAETSDIANAIFDGADAVMLSGETSVGKWPLRAAETMSRVAQRTNEYLQHKPFVFRSPYEATGTWREFAMVAEGVRVMASGLDAKLVVLWGALDHAAFLLSRSKASRPIVLFSQDLRQLRRSALLFGVTAVQLETPASSAAFLVAADQLIQERGWAKRSDTVLVLLPTSLSATAGNTLLVHRVGDPVSEAEAT